MGAIVYAWTFEVLATTRKFAVLYSCTLVRVLEAVPQLIDSRPGFLDYFGPLCNLRSLKSAELLRLIPASAMVGTRHFSLAHLSDVK